jgi:cytoskeletal protein CcmA (bactofilin family)
MKDKGFDVGEISGFLDEGTDFEGTLKFRETMRIDGKFRGKVYSSSVLIVGETAEITGEVEVSIVSINGKVSGKIKADKKIEIHSKGRVYCDISTPSLVIEDGAFFEGNCNMETSAAKVEAAEAAKPAAASQPTLATGVPKSFEKSAYPDSGKAEKPFEKEQQAVKDKK